MVNPENALLPSIAKESLCCYILWLQWLAAQRDSRQKISFIEEPKRRGAVLNLVLTSKEGLVGNVKLKDSLGCRDHEVVKFKILRTGSE